MKWTQHAMDRKFANQKRVAKLVARLLVAGLLLHWLFAAEVAAQSGNLAVLYPDIREPFRSVFLSIVQGIEKSSKASIKPYVLNDNYDLAEINRWLESEGVDAMVVLGRRGLAVRGGAAPRLRPGFPGARDP